MNQVERFLRVFSFNPFPEQPDEIQTIAQCIASVIRDATSHVF